MNRFDTVIFDLGRVLVTVEAERGLFGLCGQRLQSDDGDMLQQIISDPMIKRHNCGMVSSLELYEHINSMLGQAMDFAEFRGRWCDLFSAIDEMGRFLLWLQGRVRLGLLSDTDPLHWEHIQNTIDYLKVIPSPTLSFNIGHCKPDRECYLIACEMNNTTPERAIFIDDLQKNVDGARAVGLTAIRHVSPEDTIAKVMALLNMSPDEDTPPANNISL